MRELLNGHRQCNQLLLESPWHLRLLYPHVVKEFCLLGLSLQHFLEVILSLLAARCCRARPREGFGSWIELARLVVHLFERGRTCRWAMSSWRRSNGLLLLLFHLPGGFLLLQSHLAQQPCLLPAVAFLCHETLLALQTVFAPGVLIGSLLSC